MCLNSLSSTCESKGHIHILLCIFLFFLRKMAVEDVRFDLGVCVIGLVAKSRGQWTFG